MGRRSRPDLLIDQRAPHPHLAGAGGDDQVAVVVDLEALGAVEGHDHGIGIRIGRTTKSYSSCPSCP
jgi:hypothetical protein